MALMVRLAEMTRQMRATLLVNPTARGVKGSFDPGRIVRYLEKRGVATVLAAPGSADEATAAARKAATRGDDLVFAVGGDGTMRDVARGLAGSSTALAAVPGGTVNVWAGEAGIPKTMRAAVDAHITGQSVHIDLGRAGDNVFLLMAGIGWDAEVAGRVSQRLKKAAGDLAYVAQAVRMAPALRSRAARWLEDGTEMAGNLAWMVLGNSQLYGGRVHLTGEATIDDGLLDGLAFCPTNIPEALRLAGKVVLGRRQDARLHRFRAAEVVVETPGLAVQLDGDFVGRTPMAFSVDPGALLVSLPGGALPPVFGRSHHDRRKR